MYIVYFGSNVLTGSFPMQATGRKLAEAAASGQLRYTVVDVRANNASLHADRFVLVQPGATGRWPWG